MFADGRDQFAWWVGGFLFVSIGDHRARIRFHRGGGEQLGLRNGLHDNGFSRLRRFIDPVDIGAAEPYRGGTGRGHQKAHAFVFFARLDVVGVLHADDLARNAGAGHFQPNPIGGVLVDVFDLAHVQCLGRE
ncbi:Uncharacterised protein [Mycobacterium tuberculosis]|uniref:Uncharacterized protein n=1 Tax=Mycobacterium tuberculosis TaxID=1773 RepID=A0A0U0S3R4_MYCTX|nr:Uncharacterised protein [Mycobacterium tuberculosis]COW47603.1 Uncharacterised protein [Mycobacterium tuberculosis]